MDPRPWIDDVDTFLALAVAGRLLSAEQIVELKTRRMFADASALYGETITSLCTSLVSDGLLTPWQCDKLRRGQWRGFFLDQYLFLDRLGEDASGVIYLARDTGESNLVQLWVGAPEDEDTKIRYKVLGDVLRRS